MALVKGNLKNQIKAALEVGKNAPKDSNPDSLLDETAGKLADAIDAYIKSATVTSIVTIPVTSVPGTPGAGTATSTLIQ